jgi:hypothetical protein
MPPQPTGAYSLPSTLRMVPQGAPLYPSLMKLEKPKPPQHGPPTVMVVTVLVLVVVALVLVTLPGGLLVGHAIGAGADLALIIVPSFLITVPPKRAQ